jgi:hypothetical protein
MILAPPEADERRWCDAKLCMMTSVLLIQAFFMAV